MASVRQRKPASEKEDAPQTTGVSNVSSNKKNKYSPWLDVLRVITFLVLVSCALSYLVSNGESWFWGMRHKPRYLRIDWWKSQFRAPLVLTPEELAAYDGTDPEKPIYLAINGTIYDVTPGARMYGPGGSYRWLAGVDASRGFVTGCFTEDRNPDLRGVEQMFLPIDQDSVDLARYYTDEELKQLRQDELAYAIERVHASLLHWVQFFANSPKYLSVGRVKRDPDWLDREEPKKLCATAEKGRPKRKIPKDKKPRW